MTEESPSNVPLRAVIHRRHHIKPPPHHVVSPANSTGQTILDNIPLLPSFLPPKQPEQLYSSEKTSVFLYAGPGSSRSDKDDKQASPEIPSPNPGENLVRIGFQNPWDSWHKPTLSEVWNGLRWTQQGEEPKHKGHTEFEAYRTAIEEARRKESGQASEQEDESKGTLNASQEHLLPSKDAGELKESDLAIHKPDFSQSPDDATSVKATWLGHATVLLQLPSSKANPSSEPIRILFDPIFSHRCSPTQYIGPSRLYPAPCTVADLPKIDAVCISHSHYDHLDYDSIIQLWRANVEGIRFIVPLGNKAWFLGLGLNIDEERVSELDWWDEVWLTQEGRQDEGRKARVICTPAQHGSGRYGFDASRSLWSSWTIEYTHTSQQKPFRAFFGGDTGFQFHSSSPQATRYPTCPAFAEVQKELGSPHLSFLPISVGATFNFVKSYDALGVVPEMDGGLTGANHMTPFDAVRVAKILAGEPGEEDRQPDQSSGQQNGFDIPQQSVVMAIHWGTFVSGMDEIRRSMHDLESACAVQDVLYARQYDHRTRKDTKGIITFACIDHGQSIWMNLR